MARRRRQVGGAQIVGVVVLLGVALLVLKWLAITAAILAVPFGAWWLWDHHHRRARVATATGPPTPSPVPGPVAYPGAAPVPAASPAPRSTRPVPPAGVGAWSPSAITVPSAAGSASHPAVAPAPTAVEPAATPTRVPGGRRVLEPERQVVVTREEDHQDALAPHHVPGTVPTPVVAELVASTVGRGKHRGAFAVEVRLDGARAGELTATMSARYRRFLDDAAGPVFADGQVSFGDRGFQIDLRLPAVT